MMSQVITEPEKDLSQNEVGMEDSQNFGMVLRSGKILHLSFNQDHSCFACGTDTGFVIYNIKTLKERFSHTFEGGIGIVKPFYKSNLLLLVGGGKVPAFPPNHVYVWDDQQGKVLTHLEFRSRVKNVLLNKEYVVVVLETTIWIYNLTDLKYLKKINTIQNPLGLCALSHGDHKFLVCPGMTSGVLRIVDMNPNTKARQKDTIVQAHQSGLQCLQIDYNGDMVATASERGTLFRLFRTDNGTMVKEVRRGGSSATVNSIHINHPCTLMCTSSNRGSNTTIHIYETQDYNRSSNLYFMSGLVPYLASEWSGVQIYLTNYTGIPFLLGFNESDDIILIGYDGNIYKYNVNVQNGTTKQVYRYQFMQTGLEGSTL